jgi:DUF4097 and DUF4098 domain-containing protein YvlB
MKVLAVMMAGAALAAAQAAADGGRVTVPLRDPGKPARLQVKTLSGSIRVKTHAADSMIVESTARDRRARRGPEPAGLRRLESPGFGFHLEEDNNFVKIAGDVMRPGDLTILVPLNTSVTATTVNGGVVEIEGISGEVEANNTNGAVTVTNVTGSVVAHSLNGRITVSLNRIAANKEMSFSTLNGNIEVTLPADTKANLKMKTDNGDIYTDFEIRLEPNSAAAVEERRGEGGKYRVKFQRALYGSINGGGPLFSFTTLNGQIQIRKQK